MQCRKLLADFAAKVEGGDTRWAVIPGVLHADPTWGAGTTEYVTVLRFDSVVPAEEFEWTAPTPRRFVSAYSVSAGANTIYFGDNRYALDVILSSVEGRKVTLAVPSDVPLPMIHRDDLVRALVLLMDAPKSRLQEPAGGWAAAPPTPTCF